MNKYLHTVGFAVGLVAVIIVSALNGSFMVGSDIQPMGEFINPTAYSVLWLISYILSAFTIGEFLVNEKLKKKIPIVAVTLIGTCGVFFAFYKICNEYAAVFFLALCFLSELAVTVISITGTKTFWLLPTLNFIWYTILMGIAVMNLFL